MKIYCGGRTRWKTIKVIQLSVEEKMPIICLNYRHKKEVERVARELGVIYKMPEPILVTEVRKKAIGNRKGLIIDDLDVLLRKILENNVYYATMVDCDIENLERNNIK